VDRDVLLDISEKVRTIFFGIRVWTWKHETVHPRISIRRSQIYLRKIGRGIEHGMFFASGILPACLIHSAHGSNRKLKGAGAAHITAVQIRPQALGKQDMEVVRLVFGACGLLVRQRKFGERRHLGESWERGGAIRPLEQRRKEVMLSLGNGPKENTPVIEGPLDKVRTVEIVKSSGIT
jgi:hypothetical protein